jgi:hypothetical protein
MKSLRLLLPALALLASGCLKLEETFTIRADGSATLDLVYDISEQAVSQMKALLKVKAQMAALTGDEPVAQDDRLELFLNPAEDQIRRRLKPYEKLGITVDRLRVETRDNWRHVQLKATCKNLTDLAKADFFADCGFSLSRDKDGNYTLVRDPESQNETPAGLPDPETLKLMTPILDGFSTTFKIATPGKIIRTNAHSKSAYAVSWEFNFNKDPSAINKLQDQQFKVVFEGKTLEGKSYSLPAISQKKPGVQPEGKPTPAR